MNAGRKKNRIKIMRKAVVGTVGYGEPKWEDVVWKKTWAEIEAKRGREHLSGEQIITLTHFNFTCRYFSVKGIDTSMWIIHNDQRFDIQNILPDYQRKDHVIIEARAQDINKLFALAINVAETPADGEVGVVYDGIVPAATGGASPYAFSIFSGALPDGLSIDAETGVVSGTPTSAGTFAFVIRVTDAEDDTADLPEIEIEIT